MTSQSDSANRLRLVRAAMAAAGIDALLVRATDGYLNEYVPAAESERVWLSGFTGSMGDVVVCATSAYLLVDGRYHLQADREVDLEHIEVVKISLSSDLTDRLVLHLAGLVRAHGEGYVVGYEPEKVSLELLERVRRGVEGAGGKLVPTAGRNLVADARGGIARGPAVPVARVPAGAVGETSRAKLGRLRAVLQERGLDAVLLTRLDEIAWLTNLRGYEIDNSSTFPAVGWVGDDDACLYIEPGRVGLEAARALEGVWEREPESGWASSLARRLATGGRKRRVLLDPAGASVAARDALRSALAGGGEVVLAASPVGRMKAIKEKRELATMRDSFQRADEVVARAARWLNQRVSKGRPVTELDLANKVEALFREAGARALSFRVIAAAGANGAFIHYSHPDGKRPIRKGELVLLDTGAYFEAGYATDLTRTFLAGGTSARPTREQKRVYTLVLKAAVRGMKARFPVGTTGRQLDAIVRAPLWEAGHDYMHGTGHGVGILVHEYPPSIGRQSEDVLEVGMVFSIEPGLYLPGWGGVRIENLVTIERDRVEGFLRVVALTFAPLDRKLIDSRLLSVDEKQWLRQYVRGRVPA